MTTDELRIIAERAANHAYPAVDYQPGLFRQQLRDLASLGTAWLAEHPADDDEPVTVVWIETLSRYGGDMSFLKVRLFDDGFHLMGQGCYVSPRVATRRDVRDLCRILGVQLKEKS